MDKVDYLLLDYVSELRIPVSLLFRDDLDEAMNKPHHRLSDRQLNRKISQLCAAEYIQFNAFHATEKLYYGLTEKGGEQWSNVFQPDWQQFVSYSGEPLSEHQESVTLISHNRQLLLSLLQNIDLIVTETRIHTLHNWQPLYWKSSDTGYAYSGIFDNEILERLNEPEWRLAWEKAMMNLAK